MTFHRERHAVLAGNVANVDTPGYRPFDLTPEPAGDAQQLSPSREPGSRSVLPIRRAATRRSSPMRDNSRRPMATTFRSSASSRRSTPTGPAIRRLPSSSRAVSRCFATPLETVPDAQSLDEYGLLHRDGSVRVGPVGPTRAHERRVVESRERANHDRPPPAARTSAKMSCCSRPTSQAPKASSMAP